MTEIPRRRIVMLTTQLGYGGAEAAFIRLANSLSAHADITVALFTPDYGTGAYAKGHVPLTMPITLLDDEAHEPSRLRRWKKRRQRLRALKQNHDICISFLSGPNALNVLTGGKAASIVTLHGSRRYDPLLRPALRRFYQYVIDPIIYQLADRIAPVSSGLLSEIQPILGKRRTARKTVVIPAHIEPKELIAQSQLALAAPYEALRDQPVIVAMGRLSYEKGFHHLLTIFADIATTLQGAKLLLVGDGPMLAALRAQATQLSLTQDVMDAGTSAVIFAGYQPKPMPFLRLARSYVLTSATEGFPGVLLEAIASGAPILAADTPWGAREALGRPDPRPYPTTTPTVTPYGTLMPRIDQPHYHAVWRESILHALRHPTRLNPDIAAAHLATFDHPTMQARWLKLLESLR
jgi:glycosyltransferase involved in cell wall biosynthesis